MMLAAHHPDLFAGAASLSGAVDSNLPANGAVLSISPTFQGAQPDAIYGPRATQEVRWHGHNPTDLASNLRSLDLQVRSANGVPNPGIGGTRRPPTRCRASSRAATTPPLFRGVKRVAVRGGSPAVATPDAAGRIRFTVDLGPADADQQYTPGAATTQTTRSVTFSARRR